MFVVLLGLGLMTSDTLGNVGIVETMHELQKKIAVNFCDDQRLFFYVEVRYISNMI